MTYLTRMSPTCLAVLAALGGSACHKADSGARPESGNTATQISAGAASANGAAPPQSNADSAVRSAVAAELHKDKKIDQVGLTVAVNNGIVQLTGNVDNALSKDRATRISEAVRGVRSVDNRLVVSPEKRPDTDVERDVGKALSYNAATAKLPVHVSVKNGVVTLTGTVGSWQEQQLAERISDDVRGVRFTQNDLTTKRRATRQDSAVAGDVKTRLAWDVLVEHDPITATVNGSKVTLSGTVGSAAERSRAIADAWVDGVVSVDAKNLAIDVTRPPDKNLQPGVPKSDAAIASAIKEAAFYDPRVKSFNINPSVTNGVATLSGTVDTLNAKMTAEALARSTVGVTDVKNQLVARSQQPLADRVLEDRVKDALIFDPLTDAHSIFVTAKGGRIKLTGTVGTFFEKAEAFDVASRMAGVTLVDNGLEVRDQAIPYVYSAYVDPFMPYVETWYMIGLRPTGTDAEIKSRIESEFSWSPFVHPDDVHVTVQNGKATLTGTVPTFREREAAAGCALEAGAVMVDNQVKVS
jgi:osmotically-inducible protein OsmY